MKIIYFFGLIFVSACTEALPPTQNLEGRFISCETVDGQPDQDYNSFITFSDGFEEADVAVADVQSNTYIVSPGDVEFPPDGDVLISGSWNLINDDPTETYDFILHYHPDSDGVLMDGTVEIKTFSFDEICDCFYKERRYE